MSEALASSRQGSQHPRPKLTADVHLLLFDANGSVLLGKRQNTGFTDGAYHVPSGHLEAGESVMDALIREAKEEVGITLEENSIEFSHIMHNSSSGGRIAFFFTAYQWEGTLRNCEPAKCSELRWFPLGDLPDDMVDYCRAALAHIKVGRKFSVYGW